VRDHSPPHFHKIYGEHEAFVAIETGEVIEGALPKTAARLVKEWTLARRNQLPENWRRARAGEQPERIRWAMSVPRIRETRARNKFHPAAAQSFGPGSSTMAHAFTAVAEPHTQAEPLSFSRRTTLVSIETCDFDIAPEWLRREVEGAGELSRVAAE
jgi:hypothetical protein